MFGKTRGMLQHKTNSLAIKGLEPIALRNRGDQTREQLFVLRTAADIVFEVRQHLEMLTDLRIRATRRK